MEMRKNNKALYGSERDFVSLWAYNRKFFSISFFSSLGNGLSVGWKKNII